mmetsp:Transcript_20018/g.65229  ORF Transcript_20018/g.65229 Transcript_20018/m.65229 type:complete len:273 (-) Transcript_20018:519-1337(-)
MRVGGNTYIKVGERSGFSSGDGDDGSFPGAVVVDFEDALEELKGVVREGRGGEHLEHAREDTGVEAAPALGAADGGHRHNHTPDPFPPALGRLELEVPPHNLERVRREFRCRPREPPVQERVPKLERVVAAVAAPLRPLLRAARLERVVHAVVHSPVRRHREHRRQEPAVERAETFLARDAPERAEERLVPLAPAADHEPRPHEVEREAGDDGGDARRGAREPGGVLGAHVNRVRQHVTVRVEAIVVERLVRHRPQQIQSIPHPKASYTLRA